MQRIEGIISMLGNASVGKGLSKYSVIEVDGKLLKDVEVSGDLDNFLRRGFQDAQPITLWVEEKAGSRASMLMVGIKLASGKTYARGWWQMKPAPEVVICVLLIPMFGYGLLMLLMFFLVNQPRHDRYQAALAEMGPQTEIL